MVPADSDDIRKSYEILRKELHDFNPDLSDKNRVLAITKSDLLDDELREELKKEIPDDCPTVFISAVSGEGLTELKDLLWREINSENNMATKFTHRPLDVKRRDPKEDEFLFQQLDGEGGVGQDVQNVLWEEEFWDEENSVNGYESGL